MASIGFIGGSLKAQTTAHLLPYYQNFGAKTFSALPPEYGNNAAQGAPISSQSQAQTALLGWGLSLSPANSTQTLGGTYGYAQNQDGKLYIQHSADALQGTNQNILSINTTSFNSIQIAYDVTMLNAQAKSIGILMQYRVGNSGAWSTINGSTYLHSLADRSNGQTDNFTNLFLPSAANNQALVQLRWSTWRGLQTGSHSGAAIDNINIAAKLNGLPTTFSISAAANCNELFMSEYAQDSAYNNAIEVYNPTAAAKSLAGYYVTITSGTSAAQYVPLQGTITAYGTWVVAYAKANATLMAKANQVSGQLNYKATDVVGLAYSTNPLVLVNMIDKIGDPNYPVYKNGFRVQSYKDTASTYNHTLTRLMNVKRGDMEWAVAQNEWYPHALNNYSYLGWHNNSCNVSSLPTINWKQSSDNLNLYNQTGSHFYTLYAILSGSWSNPINVFYDVDDLYNSTSNTGPSSSLGCSNTTYTINSTFIHYDSSVPDNVFSFAPDSTSGSVMLSSVNTLDVDSINKVANSAPGGNVTACYGLEDDGSTPGLFSFGSNTFFSLNIYGGTTGIREQFLKGGIKIAPNPFSNSIQIVNNGVEEIKKIVIYDMLGNEVKQYAINSYFNTELKTTDLTAGFYLANIYGEKDIFSLKIIKIN